MPHLMSSTLKFVCTEDTVCEFDNQSIYHTVIKGFHILGGGCVRVFYLCATKKLRGKNPSQLISSMTVTAALGNSAQKGLQTLAHLVLTAASAVQG